MDFEKTVYSINVTDIQNVANDILDRELTEEEVKIVEEELYKYTDRYTAIELALMEKIVQEA